MSAPFRVSDLIAYVHTDGIKYIIQPNNDGSLSCTVCVENGNSRWDWCEHVQGCILTNQDAEQLWSRGMSARTSFVHVPIRPTEGAYLMVSLDPVENNPDAMKVKVMTGSRSSTDLQMQGLSEFIGFLNKGEGRLHLREMIIAWFEPVLDLDKIRCTSPRHNWNTEMSMVGECTPARGRTQDPQELMRAKSKLFLHAWSNVFHGVCNICLNAGGGGFDPATIPGD